MDKNKVKGLNKKLGGYKKLLSQAEASEKALLEKEIAILEKEIAIEKGKIEIPERHKANVKAWEMKHGKVKSIAFVDDTEIQIIFLRKFSRIELSAAESLATNEDGEINLDNKAEKLMTDCYLGGDIKLEDILGDIELFLPVANKVLYELVVQKKTIWINS